MLADVEELCDRLVVLDAASVRFEGTPGAFVERFRAADLEAAYVACIDQTQSAA
jgi:ABC-type Na+ transport system ATPase subunit NatA